MKRSLLLVPALALALAASFGLAPVTAHACPGCGCQPKPAAAEKPKPTGDIVDVAASTGKFKTLLAAAEAAGLVEVLKSDGPLTIMAPHDKAFAKLPAGTVESLLKPENKDKLVAILTYHVIEGDIKAADALKAGTATTVQGGTLTFEATVHDDHIHASVNGVNISATDISASNGTIHVIDEVLLPAAE
ncbi:MAG: fasciclin domain-containing protein [Planctomycetota bacterium]